MRGVADGVQGNERKQEVARGEAGGGRGSVGERHASPLLVLLAEEEGDRGGRRRWARPAGGAGQLGRLQVSGPGRLLFFLFFFCFVFLFNLLPLFLNFKQIQTMPKTPLNNFIWLDGLFQKLINISGVFEIIF